MKIAPNPTLVLCIALAMAAPAGAVDPANGKKLHDTNCVSCHAAMMNGDAGKIYMRENRRVKSRQALTEMVDFCKRRLDLIWFDEEVNNVAEYLNNTYYQFHK